MRYTSTRSKDIDCSFEEALTSGYAPDGGLFVPRGGNLPRLTSAVLRAMTKLAYPALMQRVLRMFISETEVSDTELQVVCESALEGFVDPSNAVPIVPIGNDDSLYVSELFHGPTFCFKDLGMRAVIQLLSLFATKRNRAITLLVSTTGDTGPAAVQAVSDIHNPLLKIAVHYPHEQISDFQRQQMTTVVSDCVHVVAFQGGGDDMDTPIKNLLASHKVDDTSTSLWTGVNSYNIGRPITQMVLYIWTYLCIAEKEKWAIPDDLSTAKKIDIILPTGAMGNIAAGYMVQRMGLPIAKFVAAVNVNDITHTTFQTGAFHRAGTMHRTLSEAINIQVPYNFERLVYYLTDCNDTIVKSWYDGLAATGKIDLNAEWLNKLRRTFDSARVTDEQMCAATKTIYAHYNKYLADPHTAVAFSAAYQLGYLSLRDDDQGNTMSAPIRKAGVVTALLATASPCKFKDSVTTAVGSEVWNDYFTSDNFPVAAKRILDLPERAPTIYPAGSNNNNSTLEETQLHWEAMARQVVAELEQ